MSYAVPFWNDHMLCYPFMYYYNLFILLLYFYDYIKELSSPLIKDNCLINYIHIYKIVHTYKF